MSTPHLPHEPTTLPRTAPGWFALTMMGVSILSFAVLTAGVLPGEEPATSFFTPWEERMITVWLASGFVAIGSGIVALIAGDRSLTTMLIVMIGIPAALIMLLAASA